MNNKSFDRIKCESMKVDYLQKYLLDKHKTFTKKYLSEKKSGKLPRIKKDLCNLVEKAMAKKNIQPKNIKNITKIQALVRGRRNRKTAHARFCSNPTDPITMNSFNNKNIKQSDILKYTDGSITRCILAESLKSMFTDFDTPIKCPYNPKMNLLKNDGIRKYMKSVTPSKDITNYEFQNINKNSGTKGRGVNFNSLMPLASVVGLSDVIIINILEGTHKVIGEANADSLSELVKALKINKTNLNARAEAFNLLSVNKSFQSSDEIIELTQMVYSNVITELENVELKRDLSRLSSETITLMIPQMKKLISCRILFFRFMYLL